MQGEDSVTQTPVAGLSSVATKLSTEEPHAAVLKQPPPWVRVAGLAIPVAAVGILASLKPEIVRGTFSNAESALRVAALLAGWVLFSRLMRRVIRHTLVRTAVIAVPATLLLWLNVAPYFQHDVEIAGSFPEAYNTAGGMAVSDGPETTPRAGPGVAAASPSPTQPVQVTAGRVRGLDGHRGSGEASIFREPDGSHLVAFRDLSVSSVPDPVLYLVPGADRERPDGGVRLGRFDSSHDRYELPAGVDLKGPLTVLVWCQRFAVPVAGATQSPV
jgi:hypothetical protein